MNPKFFRNGIVMLVLVVGTAALLFTWISTNTPPVSKGYSEFLNSVAAGSVTDVVQQGTTLTVKEGPTETYTVVVPSVLTQVLDDMVAAAERGGQDPSKLQFAGQSRPPTRRGSGCS